MVGPYQVKPARSMWVNPGQNWSKLVKPRQSWSNLLKLREMCFGPHFEALLVLVGPCRVKTAWSNLGQSWSTLVKLSQTWSKLVKPLRNLGNVLRAPSRGSFDVAGPCQV